MVNDISNIYHIIETWSIFWLTIIRLARLMIALCVVWALKVMNIFESLVVLNIENCTVKLTGSAYSQEFDNTFALSCREPYQVTQWRKIPWSWGEWQHIKYFGSLIILLGWMWGGCICEWKNMFKKWRGGEGGNEKWGGGEKIIKLRRRRSWRRENIKIEKEKEGKYKNWGEGGGGNKIKERL